MTYRVLGLPRRRRDNQRARHYRAVWAALAPFARRLPGVEDMDFYVTRLCARPWFIRRFGHRVIAVRDGRGRRRAGGMASQQAIAVPRPLRYDWIVLEEVAHCLVPSPAAGHGPEFARVFHDLVARMMGPGVGAMLRMAYATEHVRMARANIWGLAAPASATLLTLRYASHSGRPAPVPR